MHFRGQYFFLSNFYPSPIKWSGLTFPTAEHLYQARKSPSPAVHVEFAALPTPGKAKREGRALKLRGDWDVIKVDVMRAVVWSKFDQNPDLAKLLLATGNMTLVEHNDWGDTFWGVVDGKGGKNMLGLILMDVRGQLLRKESAQ